jgi:4-amino-4-deoxy-L-arabinose transferase-like glycosyltransferase
MDDRVRPALLVFAVAALLFFARLDLPLMESMEPRHAEIARQMIAEESWMTPVLNDQYFFDKPPLFFWSIIGCFQVFGVHDWAARLVPAFCGLATVMVSFFWLRRAAGPRPALYGSLVLCLSARYVYLCLWVTASLAAAHLGVTEQRRRFITLSGVCCALGVLTKGPVAVALVAVPVLVLRPRLRDVYLFLSVLALTAAPWFVWMVRTHPEYARFYFWEHHVIRYVAPFNHEEPFWFHLPGLLLGMMPWTFLLPGMIRGHWAARERTPLMTFLVAAAAWGTLFFSLSGCKRAVYILPALPPLALALGCYLEGILATNPVLARRATAAALVMGFGGFVAAAFSGLASWLLGATLSFPFAVTLWLAVSRRHVRWDHCLSATFAILFLFILCVVPSYHERFALRDAVRDFLEGDGPIICYPRTWDSVSFYLRRDDVMIFSEEQRDLLLEELRRHPRVLLVTRTGRREDPLLSELPEELAFEALERKGFVLFGRVTRRETAVTRGTTRE